MKKNNIDWKNIFAASTLLLAILLLVLFYSYDTKVNDQQKIIDKQELKLEETRKELIRLKLMEQDYDADKEYIYECYKDIELKAERSGK